ncbi:MAG: nucleotidyltransferase family protein [Cyanobacteria bacterium J06560_6]
MNNLLGGAVTPTWTFEGNPVIELLLHCLSPTPDVQAIQTLAQHSTHWKTLHELAIAHRTIPVLYDRLHKLCPDTPPKPLLDKLRSACHAIALKNMFVTSELSRIITLMATQGIDTMPYKGPILAQTLYTDLRMRQYGDLDIVIQPQNMLRVEKILIEEGYRPYFGQKTEAELAAYMANKNEHTYDFYHDQKKIFIEMHWRFWPVFFSSVHPKDIWHRREPAKIGDVDTSNLQIEDALVILCMHGSRHQWERLAWLCDVATLIEKYPNLDWEKTILTAEQWGARRMLYLGLYLSNCWLKATLPDTIRKKVLADSSIVKLAIQVDEQIFSPKTPERTLASTRYQIRARERWQDKITCAQSFLYWLLRGRPTDHHT